MNFSRNNETSIRGQQTRMTASNNQRSGAGEIGDRYRDSINSREISPNKEVQFNVVENKQKKKDNQDNNNDSNDNDKKNINKKNPSQKQRDNIENQTQNQKKMRAPIRPYNWANLDEREKADAFVDVYKNNLELKSNQNDLEDELKKLNAQIERLKKEIRQNQKNPGVEIRNHGTDTKNLNVMDYVEFEKLKVDNLKLREKIDALLELNKQVKQKKEAVPDKNLLKVIKQQEEMRNIAALSEEERKKLSDMLKMIDGYRQQLKTSEQEIKRLQDMLLKNDKGQQGVTEAQVKIRDLQSKQDTISSHYEANRQTLQLTQAELKELKIKLSKEQLISQDLRTEIDILKNEIKNYEKLEDELSKVKDEKKQFQKQLQQLASDPLFRDFNDQAYNEVKYRESREELFKIKEELRYLKEMNDQLNEKFKLSEKENLELTDELSKKSNEYISVKTELDIIRRGTLSGDKLSDFQQCDFINALGLVKWDGKDPKWRHLELTEKTKAQDIIEQLGDNTIELKKKIEHLILEKGELGLHLERQATMLRTKMDIDKEKERLHKVEITQLNEQLRINKSKADELAKLADMRGQAYDKKLLQHDYVKEVQYSKPVIEFAYDQYEEQELDQGENYFDIFIGQFTINEENGKKVVPNLNFEDIQTFFTVDFYNHDIQHTTIIEGTSNAYNFQFSFKVKADEFFISFLQDKDIKVEQYCVFHQKPVLLSSANISLAQLVKENKSEDESAVIEQTIKLRQPKIIEKVIVSTLDIKYRMRLPIFRSIQYAQEKIKQNQQIIRENQEREMQIDLLKKKLLIKIDKGMFNQSTVKEQLFIFYSFLGNEFTTPIKEGPNPVWNSENILEVVVDENFRSLAKNEGIKFILFSDKENTLNRNEDEYMEEDIIGQGNINLKNLVEGDVVYPSVKIMGKNSRGQLEEKGQIHVIVYWCDVWGEDYQPTYEHMLLARDWENKITRIISDSFRSKGLALTTAYYVMDRDQDSQISIEDFYKTIRETLGIAISDTMSDENISIYYHRLPKPFTKQNFENVFRNYLIDTSGYNEDTLLQNEIEKRRAQNFANKIEPTSIQQRLKQLTYAERQEYEQARIKSCALLSKKLQKKTPSEIFREIDEDDNGQISLFNLSNYLSYSGWKMGKEQVQKFLKIIDFNKDGNISLEELKLFLYNSESQNAGQITERQQQHFVSNIKQRILNFLKQNGLSFNDLFKLIDNDRSGFISTIELMIFLLEKLNLKLKFEEIQIIIVQFDKNNDDQIDLYEFIDGLRNEAETCEGRYESLFQKEKSMLNTIEYICDSLNNYMKTQNKTRGELFDVFDGDSDSHISKQETKQAFSKLNIKLTQPQLNEFYQFLDRNGDERVSIQEFISTIKAELNRLEKKGKLGQNNPQVEENKTHQRQSLSEPTHDMLRSSRRGGTLPPQHSLDDNLKLKLSKNIKKNRIKYQNSFQGKSNSRNQVSVADFQSILESVGQLSKEEIFKISNVLKQDKGYIVFSSFFSLEELEPRVSQVQDRSENRSRQQLTQQIFSRISRILTERKREFKDAFDVIDKDQSGSISKLEFKQAFQKMDLGLTVEEIEDMFNEMDKDKNEEITIDEFVAVMVQSSFQQN